MKAYYLLFILLVGLGGCGRPAPVVDPQPSGADPATLPMRHEGANLVFISMDAVQAAHIGCLGYERDTTPHLDEFARSAFVFRRAYSVSSWTVPASMTWFTGVYPSEHGMVNKFAVYRPPVKHLAKLTERAPTLVTLAELLQKKGYATVGFTGNAGVSGGFGYDRGFDLYSFDPDRFGTFEVTVPRALEWLRVHRGRRFFLFLHGYDAHGQSLPQAGLDYRFVDPTYDRRYRGSEAEQETLREVGLSRGRLSLREADVRFWHAVYDEKIHRADARLRRFFAGLQELGLMENTIFVITSDHGTEFAEHGRFDHGFSLYDELLRVPLIVRLPGQKATRTIDDRISSVDVMPTVLDLIGLPTPPQVRGVSLVTSLQGQSARRDIIAETDYREYTYLRSIIDPDGWKLICTMEKGTHELFDLNTDPAEQHNRADAEPARVKELKRRLSAHFERIGHPLTGRKWDVGLNPVYPSQGK